MIEIHYHFCSTNWADYEPEDYASCFDAELMTDDYGNMERRVQVGEMGGYLVHLDYARERHESLFRIFDDHSMSFSAYFKALFSKGKNDYKPGLLEVPPSSDNMLIIENLIIYPRFRGKDLGLKSVDECHEDVRLVVWGSVV